MTIHWFLFSTHKRYGILAGSLDYSAQPLLELGQFCHPLVDSPSIHIAVGLVATGTHEVAEKHVCDAALFQCIAKRSLVEVGKAAGWLRANVRYRSYSVLCKQAEKRRQLMV
jgi:hypothetical protein